MSFEWSPPKGELERGIDGLTMDDVSIETQAVMGKLGMNRAAVKPLVLPIHHSSTYRIDSVKEYLDIIDSGNGFLYSRLGNPSCVEVEVAVKVLEKGAGCLSFSTGMGAVSTAFGLLLRPGDHVVAQNPIYSGVHRYLTLYGPQLGIEYTWVEAGSHVDVYREACKDNTKMIIVETPCNPLISITDLEALGKLGEERGVITMVDSTYATPFLLQPITFGIDLVIHSATKYLGGHSDLLAGLLITRTEKMWTELNVYKTTVGNCLSAFDASLLSRGLKTLHVRMERHCLNASRVAEFLDKHPMVDACYYPGLKSHPGHEIAARQMKDFGGMISFEVKGGVEAAKNMVESLRVIQLAVSLGGVESLVEHPATMTHGPMIMTDADRKEAQISDGLVRLSVGLENSEDIMKDLEQAFARSKKLCELNDK